MHMGQPANTRHKINSSSPPAKPGERAVSGVSGCGCKITCAPVSERQHKSSATPVILKVSPPHVHSFPLLSCKCALTAQKGNCNPSYTKRSMVNRLREGILPLCSALVRPHLECYTLMWSPQHMSTCQDTSRGGPQN